MAKTNFVPDIERCLFPNEKLDHGVSCAIDIGELGGLRFNSTLGEFLEKLQELSMSAYRQGQRAAYEEVIANGVRCPVCEEPFDSERELAEDVLMCEICRYEIDCILLNL